MPISKEERKSYEDGKKEKEYVSNNPIGFSLGGGVRNRPSNPSNAADYDKGLKGEQLDKK